jgi:TonB family protein
VPNNAISTVDTVDAEAPIVSSKSVSANVVVLAKDAALLDMLTQAVEGRRHIWRADDVVHAADLLLAAPYAVLLLDAALAGRRTAELVERVCSQFPDLPIIVSGRLDDEVELGPLISNGIIFRFLHKPVSVERTRNFIEAAVRRLDDTPVRRAAGDVEERPPQSRMPALRLPRIKLSRRFVRRTMGVGAALLVLVLLGWGIAALIERVPWDAIDFSLPDRPARPEARAHDAAVQKLLDAAGIALSQGRLVDPEGRNAIELYRAALAHDPANTQAQQGLVRVADELLRKVEQALLDGDLAVAASALDSARSAYPGHPRIGFLSIQLSEDSKRRLEHAAETASGRPTEARALAQQVATLLAVADQRMKAGKLVGGLDSAEAYLLDARRLAPDDPAVRQALAALSTTMLFNARQAWAEGNEPVARNWSQRAQALSVDPEGIARFNAQMASARQATMVEDRSRLLALANQRLAQGRLLRPTTDSARHYLDLLHAADPAFPGAAGTEALLAARLLDEARRLSREGRPSDAKRYLAAAETAGAGRADLDAARTAVTDAQAAAEATQAVLPEGALKKTVNALPAYPVRAASRGTEGWVEVEFTVASDGSTRDAVVLDASPKGVFDDAVLNAVRHWRYEPRIVAGKPADQRVKARLRFTLADG